MRAVLRAGSIAYGYPELDALPWEEDVEGACAAAIDLLNQTDGLGLAVAEHLNSLSAVDIERVVANSSEKATHYKWYLGGNDRCRIWLHEYKPPSVFEAASTYAASIHNHRYPFASRVVAGEIRVRSFELGAAGMPIPDPTIALGIGQTMALTDDHIHQVTGVEARTVTLVIQGPKRKDYSCVWSLDSGDCRRVYDLDSLFTGLYARLR